MNALPNKLLQCPLCEVKVHALRLADHLRQRCRGTQSSVGACPLCASSLAASELAAHLDEHAVAPPNQAQQRQGIAGTPDTQASPDQAISASVEFYICSVCGERVHTAARLLHAARCAGATKPPATTRVWQVLCRKCGQLVATHELAAHEMAHHSAGMLAKSQAPGTPDQRYCPVCGMHVTNRNDLLRHLRSVCAQLMRHTHVVACPACGWHGNGAELRQHLRNHCAPLVQCPHCQANVDPADLEQHQRTRCLRTRKAQTIPTTSFTPCPLCAAPIKDQRLYQHLTQRCGKTAAKYLVACPWCSQTMPASILATHLRQVCAHNAERLPKRREPLVERARPSRPNTRKCPHCASHILEARYAQHIAACAAQRRPRTLLKQRVAAANRYVPPAVEAGPRTRDGYLIDQCSDCKRRICLVPNQSGDTLILYDIEGSRRAARHQCDGEPVPYREDLFATRRANVNRKTRKRR